MGFRRTAGVLGGAWADRPLNRGVEIPEGTARVRLGRADGFGRSAGRGMRRRAAVPAAMVAILVAVVATAGLLTLRGGGPRPASSSPAGSMAGATPHGTPQRHGRSWRGCRSARWAGPSPGRPTASTCSSRTNLGSIVYDRSGNQVSAYGQFEGWLDATHLISGDGHVTSIDEPYTGGPTSNSWVVGNGHGSAAIIVAVPGCTGDPTDRLVRERAVREGRRESDAVRLVARREARPARPSRLRQPGRRAARLEGLGRRGRLRLGPRPGNCPECPRRDGVQPVGDQARRPIGRGS